ncbi:MAG: 4Fe-4S dicluster domain-containing protein [Deltaproteobacteria bacterium]|jgi:protein NrfC|nr:4Fe-4S dicluster domain-containing protein [Deltaproteobacteria bacterium]
MSEDRNNKKDKISQKGISRRDFLVTGGAVAAGTMITGTMVKADDKKVSHPASKGYLIHDSKKCIGCTTCMLACSLTHYGVQGLSRSRIQIIQDSWGKFPGDLKMALCRQCKVPVCVQNCPVGAAFIDTENGNVRRIDSQKCIGCKTCLKMCPQQPHRTVWVEINNKWRSSKCDLCLDTPFWDEKGGPGGKQACIEACPVQAIRFVSQMPDQQETEGYDVNLRNDHWYNLGLVDRSEMVPKMSLEWVSAEEVEE